MPVTVRVMLVSPTYFNQSHSVRGMLLTLPSAPTSWDSTPTHLESTALASMLSMLVWRLAHYTFVTSVSGPPVLFSGMLNGHSTPYGLVHGDGVPTNCIFVIVPRPLRHGHVLSLRLHLRTNASRSQNRYLCCGMDVILYKYTAITGAHLSYFIILSKLIKRLGT